jgi:hypothetical protein
LLREERHSFFRRSVFLFGFCSGKKRESLSEKSPETATGIMKNSLKSVERREGLIF